ncbi:extracellular solute-binding protein [Streptomyces albipurpureus]|uniref:Extracellular solute-binding protein n=1 Tax=Streptomyces albipurpureus TaxID=2897419 RepID=A0ABT0UYV6_9ACTN|nr:extracellular solute-binding protein [Streptomyces sp. CWNU-1]MCM2393754.1 extracellular solute-binding protein [Streptomyces sp. CWNU-1]
MQRHFFRLTAATAALGMAITLMGCTAPEEPGVVTLKLVAADYDVNGGQSSRKYWANIVSKFESTHSGIKVDVQIEPWTSVDRKVAEMVKAGQGPDIAQIGAYADYAADDKLYSANDLLSVPVQSNFLAPLVDAGEQRGVQYGLPFAASTRLLFYNKKHFAKAGIAKPPENWSELRQAAQLLKDNTDVEYPFALPLGPEEAQAETMMWMLGSGSDGYVDPGGGYTIDSHENTTAFEWLKSDLVDPKLTGPVAPGKLNRKEAFAAFTRGDVGMLNGHPSLMRAAESAGIQLGKVIMPGRSGRPKATMGVADWIMGFKQNGHQREIGTFLNTLFTDENVLAFAAQNDLLPVTITASDAMAQDPKHKNLTEFLDELPHSVLPPVHKTSWAVVSEEIKQNIGNAVKPGGNPQQVLEGIAQKATEAEGLE